MLRARDAFSEIETIDKVDVNNEEAFKKASLKLGILILKVLLNIRANTVLFLEHFNIEKVKPNSEQLEK